MYKVLILAVVATATAAPQGYSAPGSRLAGGRGAAAGVGAVFNQAGGGFQASQSFSSGPVVAILRDDRNGPVDGVYDFAFETADGLSRSETGSPVGPEGSVVQQGSWSFTFPDGTPGQFSFIADDQGYRVESPLLPVGPPMPAHALEQIAKAERERAAGIIHDGQYRGEGAQGGFQSQSQGGFRQQSQGGFRGQGSYQ